jgi:hypothetical protein
MQKTLNLRVKYRESFRPFAPAVLREDVFDWFELDADSPYMLLVAGVKFGRRQRMTNEEESLFGIDKLNVARSDIPAVTNVVGTDIGVDPLAIDHLQMALLSYRGIPSSRYSVNHSVKSTHDLLATMSGINYVVTRGFHGVVCAHLLNKPVLAIPHHPKVTDLMTELELELSSYCVDIRDFDPELLMEEFASVVINAEEIKSRMAASLTRNSQ